MKKFERFKVNESLHVPSLYDYVGNVVRFGYEETTKTNEEGEVETVFKGYNVPLTGYFDYGHIKSQIIEYVYAPKEEFALLNNAVSALLKERAGITDPSIEEDINSFLEFEEWREMASTVAHDLMDMIK